MELFFVASMIGTMVLLVAHFFDHSLDWNKRLIGDRYDPQPGMEAPAGELPGRQDPVARYDRAA